MKGVVAKKSLLSFHTIDGNHLFTIISVHTFFFKNTISEYCGWGYMAGQCNYSATPISYLVRQMIDTCKKLSHFSTELYCFGHLFWQDNCIICLTVVMGLIMLPYSKQNL